MGGDGRAVTRAWAAICLRGGGAEGSGGRERGGASRMGCMNAKMADAAAEVHMHANAPPVVRLRACVHACMRTCMRACMRACMRGWEGGGGLHAACDSYQPSRTRPLR